MSGENTTNVSGRFPSQSNLYANNNKKYPGSPKSPLLNSGLNNSTGGNRNSHTRQRLLASKISAPRPINLPSLRREHAAGTEVSSSPGSQHGWGSANSSPSIAQTEVKATSPPVDEQNVKETAPNNTKTNSSPTLTSAQNTTRAWSTTPSTAKTQVPADDFPTAAESSNNTNKVTSTEDDEYSKFATANTSNAAWDEMVNEDFDVNVMEFDDGYSANIDDNAEPNSPVLDTVSPSERFNDDYDRSYTNQHQRSTYNRYEHNMNNGYKLYRRSVDHGYNTRYNNNFSFDNKRQNNGEGERRSSASDRWSRRESSDHYNNREHYNRRESFDQYKRRSSYDKKSDSYHPPVNGSLHQRTRRPSEQSLKSEHSREDTHEHSPLQIVNEPTEEITVAQKNVMLTAAERAKKRFDEQEAEYKAAAERARQKAAALAAQTQEKKKTAEEDKPTDTKGTSDKQTPVSPNSETSQPPDTSKPWNLVAAKHESQKPVNKPAKPYETSPKILTHASETEKPKEANKEVSPQTETDKFDMTQDEKNWSDYVMRKRNNEKVQEIEGATNNWNSFATRLQQRDGHKYNYTYHQPEPVEVHEFSQNEEWGTLPSNLVNGRARTGWTKNEEHSRARGRGRATNDNRLGRQRTNSSDLWRPSDISNKKLDEPGMIEILKHEPKKEPTHEPETKSPKKDAQEELASLSNKERVTRLLQTSSASPLFPNFLEAPIIKKPTHLNFMIDIEDSEKETVVVDQVIEDKVPSTPDMEEDTFGSSSMDKSASISSSAESASHIGSPSPSQAHANLNFPLLAYQYPQDSKNETSESKEHPSGVYFMPPRHYLTNTEFMVPHPQAGTGDSQPIYFPSLPWQQQDSSKHHYESSPNNKYRNEWTKLNNEYQRYNNSRGNYRKRGTWSNNQGSGTRGRGYKRYSQHEHDFNES